MAASASGSGSAATIQQPLEELLTLPTLDDFPTQAVLHHPNPSFSSASPPKPAVVIAAATGVPGIRFYASFARYLASHGHPVLVFDYRYLGRSFPSDVDFRDPDARTESLKTAPEVNISLHWTRDAGAAIRCLHERYCRGQGRELTYIGNSHGAHLLPLAIRERDLVDRGMACSTFSPTHCYFPDENERAVGMKIVIAASRQEGYFLATLMGRGMNERDQEKKREDGGGEDESVEGVAAQAGVGYDLTLGAGEEWVRWCTLPRYIATEHVYAFTTFAPRQPFVSVGFTDDPFTKGRSLPYDQMLYTLPLARSHRLVIDPQKMGKGWGRGCKHVDAFREKQREGAWEMMRQWIETGKEPTGEGVQRAEFGGTLADFEKDRGALGAGGSGAKAKL